MNADRRRTKGAARAPERLGMLAVLGVCLHCGANPRNETTAPTASLDAASPVDAGLGDGQSNAAEAEAEGSTVSGTIVDFTTDRRLSGRSVWIGTQSVTTDANGAFTLPAPPVYDAIVVDPDGSSISIYRGITRRDPVLPHQPSATQPGPSNASSVSGDLSGGGNYPLASTDSVDVFFFSPVTDGYELLGEGLPAAMDGPGYGPMTMSWNGSPSVAGQLMSIGRFLNQNDGGYASFFVDQPLTLDAGATVTVGVALSPIEGAGTVSGTITLPEGYYLTGRSYLYRPPIVHASIPVPVADASAESFSDLVPDLTANGFALCTLVEAGPASVTTELCGIALGSSGMSIALQAAPTWNAPTTGTVTPASQFSWTPYANGVHVLQLVAMTPSAATPTIYVYTADASLVWPDLTGIGVPFPSGASYQGVIAGFGPYTTIDDAFGPDGGIGDPFPNEKRRSYAQGVSLMTVQGVDAGP